MSARQRVFRNVAVLVVLLGSLAAVTVYFTLPSRSSPPRSNPAARGDKNRGKPVAKINTPARELKKADAGGKSGSPVQPVKIVPMNVPEPPDKRTPKEIVEETFKLYFGMEVQLTRLTLENGKLTLEGSVAKNRQIQDAREVAVAALEEAGYGPFPEDKIDNQLRKSRKE